MTDVQELVGAVKVQQQSIQQLTEVIGRMTQIVAMLLGEELGTPAPEREDVERDMDGDPIL